MNITVTGGLRRGNHSELASGQKNHLARLISLAHFAETNSVLFDYVGHGGVYPDVLPGVRFTAGCRYENAYLLPTPSEVLAWDPAKQEVLYRVTHPLMNDVHSVSCFQEQLLITSTGLDALLRYDLRNNEWLSPIYLGQGTLSERVNELGCSDFRKLHSTGAHHIHPNFVTVLQDRYWVTCGQTGSIWSPSYGFVNLVNTVIHDGVLYGNDLVYSTIDGRLLFCNPDTGELRKTVTPEIEERDVYNLGWCRGLHFTEDQCFLGFSSSRPSTRQGVFQNTKLERLLPTHIAVINTCDWTLKYRIAMDNQLDDVFSIFEGI